MGFSSTRTNSARSHLDLPLQVGSNGGIFRPDPKCQTVEFSTQIRKYPTSAFFLQTLEEESLHHNCLSLLYISYIKWAFVTIEQVGGLMMIQIPIVTFEEWIIYPRPTSPLPHPPANLCEKQGFNLCLIVALTYIVFHSNKALMVLSRVAIQLQSDNGATSANQAAHLFK